MTTDNGNTVAPVENTTSAAFSDRDLLLKAISEGNNKLAQQVMLQSLIIDDSWIDNIENALFSVEQIVKKPKTFIKDDRELVTVEKARRVDSVSIRHLASHTQNVRRINERGRIEPSKVLAKFSDEELATYENRLVYTLIQRLKYFIEGKYQAIRNYIACYDITKMNVATAFKAGKSNVKASLNIAITVPSTGESVSKNEYVLSRLTKIRERLMIILGSDFCTKMLSAKPVRPPIMKTNMLRGNVDYNNCYNLWLFISSFTSVGYSVEITDKMLPFDDDYFDDLANVMADSIDVMLKNNRLRSEVYDNIPMGEKKVRRYKVSRDIALSDEVPEADLFDNDGAVSQFYYESIKKLTRQIAAESTANDWDNELKVNPNFRRFFKGLQKINQSLYIEVLKLGRTDNSVPKGRIEKARRALRLQQEEVAKEDIIIKLKKEDLALSEKRKGKQLERMRFLEREVIREIKRAERIAEEKRKKAELEKKRKLHEKQLLREKKKREAALKKEMREKAKLEAKKRATIAVEKQKFLDEQKRAQAKSKKRQAEMKAKETARQKAAEAKLKAADKAKKRLLKEKELARAAKQKKLAAEKARSEKRKAEAIARIKARRQKEKDAAMARLAARKKVDQDG